MAHTSKAQTVEQHLAMAEPITADSDHYVLPSSITWPAGLPDVRKLNIMPDAVRCVAVNHVANKHMGFAVTWPASKDDALTGLAESLAAFVADGGVA